MSTLTQNFGIVLPEGNDIFNPLTFNNDAFTKVDAQMKKNQDAGLTSATHNLIDGVNQILREIGTCPLFIFTATSDYEASQTFAVDGVTCSFRYADGTSPTDGAFATNQTVLCYLNGTIINLISARRQNAGSTSYTGDVVGASNVKTALDTLQAKIDMLDQAILGIEHFHTATVKSTTVSNVAGNTNASVTATVPDGYINASAEKKGFSLYSNRTHVLPSYSSASDNTITLNCRNVSSSPANVDTYIKFFWAD